MRTVFADVNVARGISISTNGMLEMLLLLKGELSGGFALYAGCGDELAAALSPA